jgi:hypothetical protein
MRYARVFFLGVLSLGLFLSLAGCQATSGVSGKVSEISSVAWENILQADDWMKENLW